MSPDPLTTFVTADLHLLHPNAVAHCGRPVVNVAEMHAWLIRRWQLSGATRDSEIFILGDLSMYKSASRVEEIIALLDQLPGRLRIVPGNHDHPEALGQIAAHYHGRQGNGDRFVVLPELHTLEYPLQQQRIRAVLCHYPMLEWPQKHRGAIHLFGHCHGTQLGVDRSRDVGIDAHPEQTLWRLDTLTESLLARPICSDQQQLGRWLGERYPQERVRAAIPKSDSLKLAG